MNEFTHWRKSSRSGAESECVEVGFAADAIGVRDTKDREGALLAISPARWHNFLSILKEH